MLFDLHTHTFLSDGELLPIELIRRAVHNGCAAIALTDHVSPGYLSFVMEILLADCRLANEHWDIRAIPGVELTHVPPAIIPELAAEARRHGAEIVVVHGETPVEPVPPGTNEAAAGCPEVDILAHPGAITPELAALAARNGVLLEVSARNGHCLGNGAVVAAARRAGAAVLVNSDAHAPEDVLTEDFAARVAAGAGLVGEEIAAALVANPQRLLEAVAQRSQP